MQHNRNPGDNFSERTECKWVESLVMLDGTTDLFVWRTPVSRLPHRKSLFLLSQVLETLHDIVASTAKVIVEPDILCI